MKSMIKVKMIVLCLVLLMPLMGWGATYYVDKNHLAANDLNRGTDETLPWRTLAKAGNTAQAGDTVYIKAGTYNETLTVTHSGVLGAMITFKAYPGDECKGEYGGTKSDCRVILDGQDSLQMGVVIYPQSYIRIEGFAITNYTWYETIYVHGYDDTIDTYGIEIVNCKIYDTSGWGVYARGNTNHVYDLLIENCEMGYCGTGIGGSLRGAIIRDNNIHHTYRADGIDISGTDILIENNHLYEPRFGEDGHEDGINVAPGSNIIIKNNIVHGFTQNIYMGMTGDNQGVQNVEIYGNVVWNDAYWEQKQAISPGIWLHGGNGDSVYYKNISIYSNTIGWGGMSSVGIFNGNSGTNFVIEDIKIRNNIFYEYVDIKQEFYSEVDSDNNIYVIKGGPSFEGLNTKHNIDPGFVDYTGQGSVNFNFHLQAGSPAIDAGNPDYSSEKDLDGNWRDSKPDIGCYEYDAQSSRPAYYISPLGSGTYDGLTPENAMSMDQAKSNAEPGDIFLLLDGSYGDVVFNTSSKNGVSSGWINYKAASGENPQFTSLKVYDSAYLIFDGFVVNGSGYGIWVEDSSHIKILNNKLNGNWKNPETQSNFGITLNRNKNEMMEDFLIEGNEIEDYQRGIQTQGLGSPKIGGPLVIRNNNVHHIASAGIQLKSSNGNGIGALIENNHVWWQEPSIIDASITHGSGIAIWYDNNFTIRGNIIHDVGNTAGIRTYGQSAKYTDVLIENNLVYTPLAHAIELRALKENIVVRNNTSTGRYDVNNMNNGNRYFYGLNISYNTDPTRVSSQGYLREDVDPNKDSIIVENNILVGKSGGWGYSTSHNNIVFNVPSSEIDSTNFVVMKDASDPYNYFEGNNFFTGTDFDPDFDYTKITYGADTYDGHHWHEAFVPIVGSLARPSEEEITHGYIPGKSYEPDPRPDPGPDPEPEPQPDPEPEPETNPDPELEDDAANNIPDKTFLRISNNIIKSGGNLAVTINCDVEEAGNLTVKIYDSKGKEIIILWDGFKEAGAYPFPWSGVDSGGSKVGSGIYLVHMKAGEYNETKKIAVIK